MGSDDSCRLCLGQDYVLVSLFSDAMNKSEMLEKIERFLYFEVKETDSVSKFICVNCVNKIDEFHSYCLEVEENQRKLIALQSCTQYPFILDGCTSIDQVAKELIDGQTYNFDVEIDTSICPEQPLNDLRLAERGIIGDVDSAGYEIALVNTSEEAVDQHWESTTENPMKTVEWDSASVGSANNEEQQIDKPTYVDLKIPEGFPTVFIKNSKLIIRGQEMFELMSRFYKLSCDICEAGDTIFVNLTDLLDHYQQSHSTKGYVKCCDLKISKTRLMALHMARHVQPEAFKCTQCGKMLTCPKILQYHMQNHLPEEKRRLACPQCPRRFSYSSALAAHSVSHLPEDERESHICDECGKAFSTASRLTTHFASAHTREAFRYACHQCGRRFGCRANLKYHLTTHEEIHQVQCSVCKKWLKNKLCLQKHMACHSEVRHQCPLCNYSAINVQSFRNHLKVQHSNIKPHVCQECGKSFKLKMTLENHTAQHTGEKKFKCEYCPKEFASSGNYYAHRKRMHYNQVLEKNQKQEQEKEKKRVEAFKRAKLSS